MSQPPTVDFMVNALEHAAICLSFAAEQDGDELDTERAITVFAVAKMLPSLLADRDGITQAMVDGLHSRAAEYRGLARIAQPGDWAGDAVFLDSVAATLKALLPPDDTTQVMSDAGVVSVVRSVYRQQGGL